MLKKIIIGVVVALVVGFASWKIFFSKSDFDKALSKVHEEVTCYHMEATMEVDSGDDTKDYFLVTDYQKKNDQHFYKVTLLDKSTNQEQIILRNESGVFVLTPLLNQVYQFEGDWPLNSPKPYLYQSMLDALESKKDVKKMSDGYLVTFKPSYENNENWVQQDIKFSSDLKPLWVNIYDENSNVVVSIVFSEVSFNPSFEDNHFNVEYNMEKGRTDLNTSTMFEAKDLPLYPSAIDINATLVGETETSFDENGKTRNLYVLSYEGDGIAFTVTQEIITPYTALEIIKMSGQLVEYGGEVGVFSNNYLVYQKNGIEYKIYSKTLSAQRMLEIVSAMEVVAMK